MAAAEILGQGAIPELRAWLAAAELGTLARHWTRLEPLRKLVVFKLLSAPRAFEFYRSLSCRERFFLFCGFPLNSISPVLEDAPASLRRLFVQLPATFHERMRADLVRETVRARR